MTELDLSAFACPDCKGAGLLSVVGSWWARTCRRCGGSGWQNGRLIAALIARIHELEVFEEVPAGDLCR